LLGELTALTFERSHGQSADETSQ